MKFKEKVVIITGASGGIGAETAKLFAEKGAITVLVARTESNLSMVSESIQEKGGKTLIVPTDVSVEKDVEDMVKRVMDKFGHIDILFNNAGVSKIGAVSGDKFVDDLRQMIDIDFLGTVYCVKHVLPILKSQGYGHILNMSSVVGMKSFANFTGYSSIMHAISGYTDGLRQELHGSNINVSIIHPALTKTNLLENVSPSDMPPPFKAMTPMLSEQVAKAAVTGIRTNRAKVVVPFQPRFLTLLNAVSVRWGDRFVRLISKPGIAKWLGMYDGKLYHEMR